MRTTILATVAFAFAARSAAAEFELVEALPLTDRIIMVHVKEGHAVHHKRGQKRGDGEHIVLRQLDTLTATRAGSWKVLCPGDANFANGLSPERIARKSKGTDFAWMIQGWDNANGRALNKDPDHAKDHWLYLHMRHGMKQGKTYTIESPSGSGLGTLELRYSCDSSRSEAVHVNLIGYVDDGPSKFAYVYHWAGDAGSVDMSFLKGASFRLVNQLARKTVFTGPVTFRAPADHQETGQLTDTPNGSYICAEVWQCDFSRFSTPGTYVVAVDRVGCSFPFKIGPDVYREAFRTTCRGLYHNRSGIALKKPYTEYERPAPHNPLLTPGFAGKLVYTTAREDNKQAIEAGIKGPIDVWGWYQDAGDWDSYTSHTNVATALCFAYETAPRNFTDRELNIPESGNGVPDILDEAAWLPRFCYRLRHELIRKGWGSGGLGLRISGDHFGGDCRADETTKGSWDDIDRQWSVSGEDPIATIRYAAIAAHLAWCLHLADARDPEKVDWVKEAVEAYAWADSHADARLKQEMRDTRAYAAAGLFRLTGDASYERQFEKDTADLKPGVEMLWEKPWGPWVYCLGGGDSPGREELITRMRGIVIGSAELLALTNSEKRALRWGGHWYMPMLVGQQTTPWIIDGIVGWALTKDTDPTKAEQFRGAVMTTCDYFLGTNALNQTWVTGLGVRHVNEAFHMDAWYNGKPTVHPGIIPYGPWKKGKDLGQGPWDSDWPNKTVHPPIDRWPGNERWFDNRNSPLSGEFTIHQNTCQAAAAFGWLCGSR